MYHRVVQSSATRVDAERRRRRRRLRRSRPGRRITTRCGDARRRRRRRRCRFSTGRDGGGGGGGREIRRPRGTDFGEQNHNEIIDCAWGEDDDGSYDCRGNHHGHNKYDGGTAIGEFDYDDAVGDYYYAAIDDDGEESRRCGSSHGLSEDDDDDVNDVADTSFDSTFEMQDLDIAAADTTALDTTSASVNRFPNLSGHYSIHDPYTSSAGGGKKKSNENGGIANVEEDEGGARPRRLFHHRRGGVSADEESPFDEPFEGRVIIAPPESMESPFDEPFETASPAVEPSMGAQPPPPMSSSSKESPSPMRIQPTPPSSEISPSHTHHHLVRECKDDSVPRLIELMHHVTTNNNDDDDEKVVYSSFIDVVPVVSAEYDNGENDDVTNVVEVDDFLLGTDRNGACDANIPEKGHAAVDDDSDSEEGTDPADDVLTQLSDALLYGKTPIFLSQLMSEFMDSAKWVLPTSPASDVQQRGGGGGVDDGDNGEMGNPSMLNYKDDVIEDTDQVKIGDKFYSHNEALRRWRQAKMKLSDKYFEFDDVGNVKMEISTFFERSALFVMNDKDVESGKSGKNENGEDDAMTLDELIKSFSLTLTSLVDESTIADVTGNADIDKVEDKKEEEYGDNGMIAISDGHGGFIVHREIIQSTPCSSPSPSQKIEDVESVETVIQELNNTISSIPLIT